MSRGIPPPWSLTRIITCCGASHTVTSMGGGAFSSHPLGRVFCRSTIACMLFLNNSPMIYSRCERMYGKVASKCPDSLMAGRMVLGPYVAAHSVSTAVKHFVTTSRALHFRKTSPTNSVCVVGVGWASGKCQGEWKVSVSARCCSAITRREIRWILVRFVYFDLGRGRGELTDLKMVFMNLSISSGFIRSLHSNTPIASFGITVKCSCNVWLIFLQNFSLSSKLLISRTRRRLSKAL